MHLCRATVKADANGAEVATMVYDPWGDVYASSGTISTTLRYTGQREEPGIGLYDYKARWYDPWLGRFIQPDPIVPDPANPQALNRYSYVLNNPVRYTDPSGYDPLDAAWQSEFERVHSRPPAAEDILIRLFSIAFPDEWDFDKFYDAHKKYIPGSLEKWFVDRRPPSRSWDDMPNALERLAAWYNKGEEGLFTRDVGSLFAGLANRFEEPGVWSAVSNRDNPIRTWVYLNSSGLPQWMTGTSDRDANVHHWAWGVVLGSAYGPGGSMINTVREMTQFRGDWRNSWSDISIGNAGAALGFSIRVFGLAGLRRFWGSQMMTWLY